MKTLYIMMLAALLMGAANPKANLLSEIAMDQPLGKVIPLDLPVIGEDGVSQPLRSFFGKRPVIFTFVYHDCPMLCGQVYLGLAKALRPLKLKMGEDFDWVTLSINPHDTSATAQAKKKELDWPKAHFLVADKTSIDTLTQALGYQYAYDAESKQFAHPSGFYVLTDTGRISRVFFGIEFSARDLRLAILEAGQGRVGNLVDKLLLFCYHYDPKIGRYGVAIYRILQTAGLLTVAGLALWVAHMIVTHRRVR